MKSVQRMILMAVVSSSVLASGYSFAGDCRNVKQHFYNEGQSMIRVKKTEIGSPQGVWTEDFVNITLEIGENDDTKGRRFNKLDSGETPDYFKVYFDRWDWQNKEWDSYARIIDSGLQVCKDDKIYHLHINQAG